MKKRNFYINPDKIFCFVNYMVLALLAICFLYPIIYIVSCSFSSGNALMSGRVRIFPVEFSLDGYKTVLSYGPIWTGYVNSVIYTAVGTVIGVALTLLAAYPLSRKDLRGRKIWSGIFLFTMLFSGGMIPSYLLIQNLSLMDTIWAIVLPGSVSAYNVIVARTFFQQSVPEELFEAASMDGCSDFKFFMKIAIHLSTPIIAVLGLWFAIYFWNSYFSPMLYLKSDTKYPLQLILRKILLLSSVDFSQASIDPATYMRNKYLSEMLKYGTIVISSLPLMILYPFVQKYFVKGILIGSVKG